MQLTLVTPPAVTPVSLAEAKAHLRVEHDEDDAYITSLIKTVTARIDGRNGWLRRALVNQTWKLELPWFPVARCIALPMPPLQSVTSIKYFDHNNEEQTFAAEAYEVVKSTDEGYIYLKTGESWPGTWERQGAVAITFVAGYGESGEAVPENIRHAIKIEIAGLYGADRGDEGEKVPPSPAIKRLLGPHKRVLMR